MTGRQEHGDKAFQAVRRLLRVLAGTEDVERASGPNERHADRSYRRSYII